MGDAPQSPAEAARARARARLASKELVAKQASGDDTASAPASGPVEPQVNGAKALTTPGATPRETARARARDVAKAKALARSAEKAATPAATAPAPAPPPVASAEPVAASVPTPASATVPTPALVPEPALEPSVAPESGQLHPFQVRDHPPVATQEISAGAASAAEQPAQSNGYPWLLPGRETPTRVPLAPNKAVEPPGGGEGVESVTVMWTMPAARGIYRGAAPMPTEFGFQWGRRVRGKWNDVDPANALITHHVSERGEIQFIAQIKQLEEGEKYTIRIRAQNELGWGDWSKKSGMVATAKVTGFRAEKELLVAADPMAAATDSPEKQAAASAVDGPPPAPLKPTESAEGHGPNYLSVSWAMPPGSTVGRDVDSLGGCEFEVQYGFETVGTWHTAPPTAATVEDDGWGATRWTMRLSENIWPSGPTLKYVYVVRVRARNARGWGSWSPKSIRMECVGGTTPEPARASAGGNDGGFDADVEDFLGSLNAAAGIQTESSPEVPAAAAAAAAAEQSGAATQQQHVIVGQAWVEGNAAVGGLLDRSLSALAAATSNAQQHYGGGGGGESDGSEDWGEDDFDDGQPTQLKEMQELLATQKNEISVLEAEVEQLKMRAAQQANAATAEEGIPPAVLEWRQEKLSEVLTEQTRLRGVIEKHTAEVGALEKIVGQRDATMASLKRKLEANGLANALS